MPPLLSAGAPAHATRPIERLPGDVLAEIFQCCQLCEPLMPIPLRPEGYMLVRLIVPHALRYGKLQWIKVSHVCRSWRNICLHSAVLWRKPTLVLGDRWFEEMIYRSGNAPLYFTFFGAQYFIPIDEYVIERMDRTERLFFPIRVGYTPECLTLRAPAMTHFKSRSDEVTYEIAISEDSETPDPSLPPRPFADHAPNLQRVSVEGYANFFWESPVLHNLTHLAVEGPFSPVSAPANFYQYPTYSQLWSALSGMPKLVNLSLRHCLPIDAPPTSMRSISLPSLAKLELDNRAEAGIKVLRGLEAPKASLKLTLWSEKGDPRPRTVGGIVPALQSHLSSPSIPRDAMEFLTFSTIRAETGTKYLLMFARADPRPDDPGVGWKFEYITDQDNRDLFLNISVRDETVNVGALLPLAVALCSMLPLRGTLALSLELGSPYQNWGPEYWLRIASNTPNVRHLRLDAPLAIIFFRTPPQNTVAHWPGFECLWVTKLQGTVKRHQDDGRQFASALLNWVDALRSASIPVPRISLKSRTVLGQEQMRLINEAARIEIAGRTEIPDSIHVDEYDPYE
ncbi:hypothetical protein BC834DRAFT_387144 [Gloeopeniophorella convolvens]|nr:hypothetical protein BC834DRAFT_387144 [Gloeopeniophorella convolvens]